MDPEELAAVGERAREQLAARHDVREVVLASVRPTIQASAASIRATHRGEFDLATTRRDEAAAHLVRANGALVAAPEARFAGNLRDAEKEYVEASITLAFVRGDALPTMDSLDVDAAAYLNGLCEAASELRRAALDAMRRGDLPAGERYLATMDDVYGLLVTIDFPDAVTGGLRRNTDALRAVLERTRADVTTTAVAARLQQAIEQAAPPAS